MEYNRMDELIAALRFAERSITMVVEDVDEVRAQQLRDHETLVQLREQMSQVRDEMATQRYTSARMRTQAIQASATVFAAVIGAAAGIASILWQVLKSH